MKVVLYLLFLSVVTPVYCTPLLEVVDIEGVRVNQLVGYGLVVGLQGTGDQTRQTRFTSQSIVSMLRQFGVQLPFGVDPKLKNVAAVSVHAQLPTYVREGHAIDIVVSSIGDAKSLQGGSLLTTPLKGLDGEVYAIAQGTLVIGLGGVNSLGLTTVARVPGGALVEKAVVPAFDDGNLMLNLKKGSFTLAYRIVRLIDKIFGKQVARALDSSRVSVLAPTDSNQRVAFMAMLEKIDVEVPKGTKKVIINARTGTVVMGDKITISPVAVSHGNLSVVVASDTFVPKITNPNAAPGSEKNSNLFILPDNAQLKDIVSVLSAVGASPPELTSILEAMKQAGALDAELEVI